MTHFDLEDGGFQGGKGNTVYSLDEPPSGVSGRGVKRETQNSDQAMNYARVMCMALAKVKFD